MTLPNFLVIGAMRCGTTTLHDLLSQHPQVFMSPVKEPRFFALEGREIPPGPEWANSVNDLAAYRSLFHGVSTETAVGEISPLYLYDAAAPVRIKRHLPDVKLIAILRDPAHRAYSHFLHHRRLGIEPIPDFQAALDSDDVHQRFRYVDVGNYADQLARYHAAFSQERIGVWLTEEMDESPWGVLPSIFRFLDVDPGFRPPIVPRHHRSTVPRSSLLESFLSSENQLKSIFKTLLPEGLSRRFASELRGRNSTEVAIPPEARAQLVRRYRPGILELQRMIGKDLGGWLK